MFNYSKNGKPVAWVHQLYDCLDLIGMRDRLRCPDCWAIGTWKPHGGWFDVEDTRKVRRWMCKWCGIYCGPEGWKKAGIDFEKGCWDLEATYRPKEHVKGDPFRG